MILLTSSSGTLNDLPATCECSPVDAPVSTAEGPAPCVDHCTQASLRCLRSPSLGHIFGQRYLPTASIEKRCGPQRLYSRLPDCCTALSTSIAANNNTCFAVSFPASFASLGSGSSFHSLHIAFPPIQTSTPTCIPPFSSRPLASLLLWLCRRPRDFQTLSFAGNSTTRAVCRLSSSLQAPSHPQAHTTNSCSSLSVAVHKTTRVRKHRPLRLRLGLSPACSMLLALSLKALLWDPCPKMQTL